MADVKSRTEDWKTLPWRDIQRKCVPPATTHLPSRTTWKQVHNLQRLLLRSWSARCLAVRQVTQDNRGKRTPGVDGTANLTPKQRMALVEELKGVLNWQTDPIRRTYIAKRGTTELRGLGIPTMTKPLRVVRLLKRDKGRCLLYGLRFRVEDVIEVHHWDGNRTHNRYRNLLLLHGHCHDEIHGRRC